LNHHAEVYKIIDKCLLPRFTLVYWLPQDNLIDIYDQHGIFIFPSYYEGAGKASLEAMSRGCCVVGTNVGAMTDYIQDGVNGRLVEPGSTDGIVEATNWFLENSDRAKKCSKLAAVYARKKTWILCAQGISDFASEKQHKERP
jgi:glycosyltransferase involved in cell wall biosynthesis